MSLMDRVAAAGNAVAFAAGPAPAEKLDELRGRVSRLLAADELARRMQENAVLAENELRGAIAQVFEADPWFAFEASEQRALSSALVDSVFGLGPLQPLLDDPEVTEIMVNTYASVFVERNGVLQRVESMFRDDDQVRALVDRIIGPLGRRIDESSPMVDARLPLGHRINVVIPPISPDGVFVTIRKFRMQAFTLAQMQALGSFGEEVRQLLAWAVLARKTIAVSGGTGSGKTTLLNALSCEIPAGERIVTIEDSAELRFTTHPNVARLEARPQNAEGIGQVTIRQLVTNALRMRPDRIVVGECRGGEALDMLQAANTGHEGSLTTLHANSAADCLMRLATMVRFAADLPAESIAAQIGSAIDLVVQTARARNGKRFVSELAEVVAAPQGQAVRAEALYRWDYRSQRGIWLRAPGWLADACERGVLDAEEVQSWKLATCL